MRYLAALALLVTPAVSLASWTPQQQDASYTACRLAGGTDSLCRCATTVLEDIQPDFDKVDKPAIEAAVKACVLPPEKDGNLSI